MALRRFSPCLLRQILIRICVFIYESVLLPYSKNDYKRLIRIEKTEQDNITGREHKFEESRKLKEKQEQGHRNDPGTSEVITRMPS